MTGMQARQGVSLRVYSDPPAPLPMSHGCMNCGRPFPDHEGDELLCPAADHPSSGPRAKQRYGSDSDAFLTGVIEGFAVGMIVGVPIFLLVYWLWIS